MQTLKPSKTIDHFSNVSALEIDFFRDFISKQFAGYQVSVDQLKEFKVSLMKCLEMSKDQMEKEQNPTNM